MNTYRYIFTWWRHQMEAFSALSAFCVGNSPVTGEFPSQRPVTRSFDVFSDQLLNKWLSKESWGWWFETPSWSLWRQFNVWLCYLTYMQIEYTYIQIEYTYMQIEYTWWNCTTLHELGYLQYYMDYAVTIFGQCVIKYNIAPNICTWCLMPGFVLYVCSVHKTRTCISSLLTSYDHNDQIW